MNRKNVTVVTVGVLTFAVFMVSGGQSVDDQTNFLADGGMAAPNRVATCPVTLDDACRGALPRNTRARFPVVVTVLPDAGRDVQLPPMSPAVRACVSVKDWTDCTLDPVATYPAVAAKWGNAIPLSNAGVVLKCVRQKADAGLGCLRKLSDGGSVNFGDRNVFPRSEAVNPAQCESCECSITAGDDPEVDL